MINNQKNSKSYNCATFASACSRTNHWSKISFYLVCWLSFLTPTYPSFYFIFFDTTSSYVYYKQRSHPCFFSSLPDPGAVVEAHSAMPYAVIGCVLALLVFTVICVLIVTIWCSVRQKGNTHTHTHSWHSHDIWHIHNCSFIAVAGTNHGNMIIVVTFSKGIVP